jgi:crotonobetainyl-CoA:carnitine CoA-transferase CaiB-like acyl-CoA transferase
VTATAADPVADWAESGVVALTGRPDGPPLVPPGFAATAAREAERAFRELSAALPVATVPIGWHQLLGERAALTGATRGAPWSVGGTARAVATADGWVVINLARNDDVAAVPALVQATSPDLDLNDAWRAVDAWAAHRSSAEVVERAMLLSLPCGEVPGARSAGVATRPAAPIVVRPVEGAAGSPPPEGTGPLVVDLSALWAGPLCAHLLGTAGARVVKIETADRLDGGRRGEPRFYDLLHAGHDSVIIDPAQRADQQLLGRLLDRADIVVSASRPRAWSSMGVDPYDVCRRSSTTWVAVTAYGMADGDRVGFGDDVAMAGGLVAREAGSERPVPVGDAIADPLTGMQAAVAALASYQAGGSRLLDVSMRGVVAATVGAATSSQVVAQAVGGGWTVEAATGPCRVQVPVARTAPAAAAAPGRDTERWRCT